MDEIKSPPPCPTTVTVRRNPPRRARPTPYSAAPPSQPHSSKTSSAIRSFPIDDILSINIPNIPDLPQPSDKAELLKPSVSDSPSDCNKLKVYLRIRPILTQKAGGSVKVEGKKNVWPQNPRKRGDVRTVKDEGNNNNNNIKKKVKKVETCLKVNDEHSVTLCVPQSLTDARRVKSEVYEGFSHVFCDESSQGEVYERMMNPLVVDFLKGKSGMLAAMGPSGSGKTHTVFGSTRQPGMVALALRQIFSQKESDRSRCSRTFYLSMFEIYSERGKGEKIMDLSQEGGDLSFQQSNIKGLKEEVIHDVQHAESLIASGMLKRSTAMTNSNIQSSRSQCIINIRCDVDNLDEDQFRTAILTIVDLAGAEREKRTGNQGARLLESNFINNTSMVFGLCLRSLLEHQKNPKKPLQKHFQNSLLTKYLRDYLEGKKRMALILTAKPGEEDYQDTSYLLRQASPFMNIKFENIEEQPLGNKRRTQTLPKAEQAKRMKLHSNDVCMDDQSKSGILHEPHKEELILEQDTEVEISGPSAQFPVVVNNKTNKNNSIKGSITDLAKKAREYHILSNFSRALWKVLKEYKNKLVASENEADTLRHSLTDEKERCAALESELNLIKASCSCGKSNAKASSHSLEMECITKKLLTTDIVNAQGSCSDNCEENVDTRVVSSIHDTSCVEVASTSLNVQNFEEHNEEYNVSCDYVVFDKEDLPELGDTEFSNDAGYGTLDTGVSDLLLLHGHEGRFLTKGDQTEHGEEELVAQEASSYLSESESCKKGDQRKHEEEELVAQDSSSDLSDSECFQKQDILHDTVTIDHEITPVQVKLKGSHLERFKEQSKERNVEVSSPNAVLDKQDFQETEQRVTSGVIKGCDNLESAVGDSELHIRGTTNSSFVKGDQGQHEEDSSTQSSSSDPGESQFFEKQDLLNDTSNAQSPSSDVSVSQCFENLDILDETKFDVSSPNLLCDKQEFKEVEETDADGEVTVAEEVSSSLGEVQPEQDQKVGVSFVDVTSINDDLEMFEDHSEEKIDVSSPNLVSDKQEFKEVDETDANLEVAVAEVSSSLEEVKREQDEKEVKVPVSSSDLEGKSTTEAQDSQLVLPEEVIISRCCNDSKLLEVPSVQPSKPMMGAKPKRRLRPASSVMLKNINILEFDDATTLPKQHRHGKRDENEDGRKRTQGSNALLRILQQNLRQ